MKRALDLRAAERLQARRRRIARIRKRTLAAVAGTFVLAWGVVFVQLVSGHDPALALAKRSVASASSTNASAAPRTSASGSTSSTASRSASSATTSSGSASPVTTSQS